MGDKKYAAAPPDPELGLFGFPWIAASGSGGSGARNPPAAITPSAAGVIAGKQGWADAHIASNTRLVLSAIIEAFSRDSIPAGCDACISFTALVRGPFFWVLRISGYRPCFAGNSDDTIKAARLRLERTT